MLKITEAVIQIDDEEIMIYCANNRFYIRTGDHERLSVQWDSDWKLKVEQFITALYKTNADLLITMLSLMKPL